METKKKLWEHFKDFKFLKNYQKPSQLIDKRN